MALASCKLSSIRLLAMALLLLATGCHSVPKSAGEATANLTPSNQRKWSPDQATLASATFYGDQVSVQNIRNCQYLSKDDYVVEHYDQTFNLKDAETVDFLMIPFPGTPTLAHTMISFGFKDGKQLAISVEIRKEDGEVFKAVNGMLDQYELMYVVGDERDLIGQRAVHRKDDVYLYRLELTPAQVQAMFVDVMQRVNGLREKPEFYHTLSNNCTTNLVAHLNKLFPNRVPYDYRVLLPGYSDQLAYDVGLIDNSLPFAETRRRALISDRIRESYQAANFSESFRRL